MKPECWLDDYNFDIEDSEVAWTCWVEYHYGSLIFNSEESKDMANGKFLKQLVKKCKVYYDYL